LFFSGETVATIGKINAHASELRRNSTDAEQRLWRHLRNRNLSGFKFRRQETVGPFVADFACVERKVIVEADGGQHELERDRQRTSRLESLGWIVLRFWNDEVLTQTEAVLEAILRACEERGKGKPSPCPLPRAGEGN
jgi:very-short-patch-repair endonuclease